jgi:signal transduction histidine kinase
VRDIAAKLEKYICVAKGEVNRLDYIVTQFLQAIRPSKPKLKKSSLNDTIEETIELLRPEFDNRGQSIKLEFAKSLPLAVFDAAQIKQSLINLMKNSMHAMSTGGELGIKTGEAGGGVWVSLTDTGGGIPQEQIKRIFEPYYTTKEKGSGLGLMIVQRIVRDHDGRLELMSHGGKGTTFRVWLPQEERRQHLLETAANEA